MEVRLKQCLNEIEKNNSKGKKINAILQINPNVETESRSGFGKLAGKVVAVKANINVRGLNASCASKVLKDYKCPYDATVIGKIKGEGASIIGMCNMDEFACGWSGETSAFGATKNPSNLDLIAGGSSSGSAAAVAAGFCDVSLCSDTGGSIRNPAAHCGVVGLKPSYGAVSRYGLIDLSMSLDQIGVIGKSVKDVHDVYEVIKGKDERDATSLELEKKKSKKELVVGVLDLKGFKVEDGIEDLINEKIERVAKKNGWKVVKIKIPYIDLAVATYYPLVYVEFFSGTRKFDGRRYGKKIEEACGPEVLRRVLGGSEISKAEHAGRYYYQALKAKKLISQEFEKAFKKVDCIVSPTLPKTAHKIGQSISNEEMFAYDVLTIPYNLYGNCAISIPAGKVNGKNVGLQIACDRLQDDFLLELAERFERS